MFAASVTLSASPLACPAKESEAMQGEFVMVAVPVRFPLKSASELDRNGRGDHQRVAVELTFRCSDRRPGEGRSDGPQAMQSRGQYLPGYRCNFH